MRHGLLLLLQAVIDLAHAQYTYSYSYSYGAVPIAECEPQPAPLGPVTGCNDTWAILYPGEQTDWQGRSCYFKKNFSQCAYFWCNCRETCGICERAVGAPPALPPVLLPPSSPELPPPEPPSPSLPSSDPCFPSLARVIMANGSTAPIDKLLHGDSIFAATASGAITVGTVSLLSIAKPKATNRPFVALTAANRTLLLTPEHHLPVGDGCCSRLKKAKDVVVGDLMWVVSQAGRGLIAAPITSKKLVLAHGLHSPVLTNGGFPIVDGVATAFDRIEAVKLAALGLPLLLKACEITATCEWLRHALVGP